MKKIILFCFALFLATIAIFFTSIIDVIIPPQYRISIDMSPQEDDPDNLVYCFANSYYIKSPSFKDFQETYNQDFSLIQEDKIQLDRKIKATNIRSEFRRDFFVKEGISSITRYNADMPMRLWCDLFLHNERLFINIQQYGDSMRLSYIPAKQLGIDSFQQWADFRKKHPNLEREDLRNAVNAYQGHEVQWQGNHGTYCESISPGKYIFCIDSDRKNALNTVAFMLEHVDTR